MGEVGGDGGAGEKQERERRKKKPSKVVLANRYSRESKKKLKFL